MGVAKLTVPFTGASQSGAFTIDVPSTNFTTGTITIQLYVPTPGGATNLQVFVQGTCGSAQFDPTYSSLTPFLTGFAPLTFNVGALTAATCPTAFDKSAVTRIGFQFVNGSAGSGGTTTAYVDSISLTSTPAVSYTYTTAADVGTTTTGQLHVFTGFLQLPLSTVEWFAAYP